MDPHERERAFNLRLRAFLIAALAGVIVANVIACIGATLLGWAWWTW